jgi:hypothetical protein
MLVLAATFWGAMSVLLWRAEFGGRGNLNSAVPVEQVWQRVLGAADYYRLEVRHHRKSIGFVRWFSAVVEQDAATPAAPTNDAFAPEGRVVQPAQFNLDLDGMVSLGEERHPLRFDLSAVFSSNRDWRELDVRANLHGESWQLKASATEQSLSLGARGGAEEWNRTFTFEQLRNPEALVREFAGPWAVGLLGVPLAGLSNPGGPPDLALGLRWEARTDWMQFGQSRLRVYRVEAKLLDRYPVTVFISRAGEILRAELPDDVVLVNEGLASF